MRLGLFLEGVNTIKSLVFTDRLFHRVGAAATNALSQESWYSSQVDVVCLCPFVWYPAL